MSADAWRNRRPAAGETCVFPRNAYWRGNSPDNLDDWKRDALLFDRVYVPWDPNKPPDIPMEISFGVSEIDAEQDAEVNALALAAAHGAITNIESSSIDFERLLTARYWSAGVMGEWSYDAGDAYLRRFSEGEVLAYEAAINNLPLVTTKGVTWEQIIDFRKDPDAARKYRDLRIWLRDGLNASSVQHATDVISQKIEDYRWAIRKHGFSTAIGAISQLLDWKESRVVLAAGAAGALAGGPIWAALTSGLAVTVQMGVLLAERWISSKDTIRGRDREIAILYDVQQRFGR